MLGKTISGVWAVCGSSPRATGPTPAPKRHPEPHLNYHSLLFHLYWSVYSIILVTDNALIHKTKGISEFLESKEARLLTIYLYSPWLNPIEGYIYSIKKRIKMKLESGKILIETMIRLLMLLMEILPDSW